MKLKMGIFIYLFFCLSLNCADARAFTDCRFTPEKVQNKTSRKLDFKIPNVLKSTLDNGITLFTYSDHEIPLITARILLRTGSFCDFKNKEGIADITGRLVRTGGVVGIPADSVDEMLDQFAGYLEFSVSADTTTAMLSVLKDDLDKGLLLFSRMIISPAFEEQKLQIAKSIKIEELRRLPDDPFRLARREFNRQMYKDDPRGRYPSIKSIEEIKREDLIQFHKKYFRPENMAIAVSGDITHTEAFKMANKYFGSWKLTGATDNLQQMRNTSKGGVYFVKKAVPQSVILIGYDAPGKKDSSYFPFSIFDFIIGSGGFTSRIFQKVRTDQGLAYSTGSFYRADINYGQFVIYAITKSSSTHAALLLLQSIISDANKKGVTEGEMSWAKKSVDNGFLFSFLTADQIAYQQMKISHDKLPSDYLATYRKNISKVAANSIQEVVNKYLTNDSATLLILGNDEALKQVRSIYPDVKEIVLNNE